MNAGAGLHSPHDEIVAQLRLPRARHEQLANAKNVFWAALASSTIGSDVVFQGTVLTGASNSVGTDSGVVGRLLCTTGPITLLSNTREVIPERRMHAKGSVVADKMLQGRLYSYGDAQRYRSGVNHNLIPVNAPRCPAHSFHHNGAVRVDGNHGSTVAYEPNRRGERSDQPAAPRAR